MGLLDIVPGVKEGIAGVVGGAIGYFFGSRQNQAELKQLKKQYATLEEEVHDLRVRLGMIDEIRQCRALVRIAILRQLAWKDGKLENSEKLYVYEYVLKSEDLPADIKLQVMREITCPPTIKENFWIYIKSCYASQLFANSEEKLGFKAVLIGLACVDGFFDPREESYIQQVLESCGIPKN